MLFKRVAVLAGLLISAPALAQVPPPPVPDAQRSVAEQLVKSFSTKDLVAYGALLAADLQVYEDSRLVARTKQEWLDQFGKKLAAEGVSFILSPGYASHGKFLFVEYANSLASWGRNPPPVCCWGYDAVQYEVIDGKIRVIRRLTGGAFRLGPDGKVAKDQQQ